MFSIHLSVSKFLSNIEEKGIRININMLKCISFKLTYYFEKIYHFLNQFYFLG